MFFSIITFFMLLFAYPQSYFPGLPPYLPRYFDRNFPKILVPISGKYKLTIVLYRNIFCFHTLYRVQTIQKHEWEQKIK